MDGHSVHKNKGFAPQTPESDENDKHMASATHAKTLFAKDPSSFVHPDLGDFPRTNPCFHDCKPATNASETIRL